MAAHFKQAKECTSALQTYATSAVRVLPPYDIRRSQEIIESVNGDIKTSEAKLLPKKKFSFANRNKKAAPPPSTTSAPPPSTASAPSSSSSVLQQDADTTAPEAPQKLDSISLSLLGSYQIVQQKDQRIILTETDITAKLQQPNTSSYSHKDTQVLLKQCTNTYIAVEALVGSVRCEDLNNCEVTLGPCCTSVYLENVVNSTLRIACHQLRIHTSRCIIIDYIPSLIFRPN
jgi:tubulin-specific chaperone C